MTKIFLLVVAIMLVMGIFFARDRLRRAFQIGAALYAVVLIARFLVFGLGDRDNLTDLLVLGAIFFLIWLIAWGGTQAILRYRARQGPPRPAPVQRRRRWR
jgi:hypothetical protein